MDIDDLLDAATTNGLLKNALDKLLAEADGGDGDGDGDNGGRGGPSPPDRPDDS